MKELDRINEYMELTRTLQKLEKLDSKEKEEIKTKKAEIVTFKSHFNQPIELPLSYIIEKLQEQYTSIKSSVVLNTIFEKNDIITGEDLIESLTEPTTVKVDLFDAGNHPIYSFRTKVIPAKLEAKCRVCNSINQEKDLHTFICETPEDIKVDIKIEDIIKDYSKGTTVKYPFESVTLYDVIKSYKRHHKESDPHTVYQISELQKCYFNNLERICGLEKSNEYTQKAIKETKVNLKLMEKQLEPVRIPVSDLVRELANITNGDVDARLNITLPTLSKPYTSKDVKEYLAILDDETDEADVLINVPAKNRCYHMLAKVIPAELEYLYHTTIVKESRNGDDIENLKVRCTCPKELTVRVNYQLILEFPDLCQAINNYNHGLETETEDGANRN